MYFVFNSEIKSWHNQIIQAKFQDEFPAYEPHWWLAEPITPKLPVLKFGINAKAPRPDNFFTRTVFDIYSKKLIELMSKAGVRFETFPTVIVDRKTQQVLPHQYNIFHLLEIYSAMDQEQSDVGLRYVRKIVLTETSLQAKKPFFRLKESIELVLIHEDFKAELDAEGVTGCSYIPLEEFQVGNKSL